MQLRYLQTLIELGTEQNSTVIFPMPIDIIKPFLSLIEAAADVKFNGDGRASDSPPASGQPSIPAQ